MVECSRKSDAGFSATEEMLTERRQKLKLEAAIGQMQGLGYEATPQWARVPYSRILERPQSPGEVHTRCYECGPS